MWKSKLLIKEYKDKHENICNEVQQVNVKNNAIEYELTIWIRLQHLLIYN